MIGDKSPYHVSFAPCLRLFLRQRIPTNHPVASRPSPKIKPRRILPQLRALDARAESGMLRVAGNCWD